jgi:hypothetical protein
MRRNHLKRILCSLLAVALLVATSQYLAHFHVQRAGAFAQAHADAAGPLADQAHGGQEHCSLCLQFDRLPAPPSVQVLPTAYFFHIATVEAQRLERLALDTPQLWPPSRGPPRLAC